MSYNFYIYIALLTLIVLIGGVRFTRLSAPFKVLTVLILLTIVSECVARHFAHAIHNNAPVYHFYVLVSFWMYSYIFQLLFKSLNARFTVLFITIPFTIFSIINSIAIQGLMTYPSYSIIVHNVLLVSYSLLLFRQLLDNEPRMGVLRKGYFWFNIAVMFFFAVQLLIWGMYNYFLSHREDLLIVVNFSFGVDMVYYTALGVSLWMDSSRNLLVDQPKTAEP